MSTEDHSVVRALLSPAIWFLILLFIFFTLLLKMFHGASIENSGLSRLDFYKTEFQKSFDNQATSLVSLLDLLSSYQGVGPALADRDRTTLFNLLESTVARLQETQGITHFYFHDDQLTTLLRFHEPEGFDDPVRRKTSTDAFNMEGMTYGFELGTLGTFSIRAVNPVRFEGRVVGYLELGKEIEAIASDVARAHDLEWVVLINKSALSQEEWMRGMAPLNRDSDWDRFDNMVKISESDSELSTTFDAELVARIYQGQEQIISVNEAQKLGLIPLADSKNRPVGQLIVLVDQTEAIEAIRVQDQLLGFLLVPLLLLTIFLIWAILRHADKRISAQQGQLEYQAYHDALTGLPNRDLLYDRLEHALTIAERRGQKLAAIFIDLDNFKDINDSQGHQVGDEVLVSVSDQVNKAIRKEDTLARISGDEFVILMEQIDNLNDCSIVAEKISRIFAQPLVLSEKSLAVTLSMGIAVYPDDACSADDLIIAADRAMYLAKDEGKNRYHFYNEQLAAQSLRRIDVETRLRTALGQNRLSLHYQPQISVETGEVAGVEALLRWTDPELGPVRPDEFIPIAESAGLINSIGRWVLTTACHQAAVWYHQGIPFGRVAINVSGKQLTHNDFSDFVSETLATLKLPARCLELEVTESVFLSGEHKGIEMLQSLKQQGVTIAVDDFGTGYSSLSKIRTLPITTLKIDKSFIDDVPGDENDTTITLTILALAKSLSLKTVAEGVENAEQLEFLSREGCDEVQGYYFSRPVDALTLVEKLASRSICPSE